jgi:hypothetical protein
VSDKTIRAALEGRLATWAATQSLTVAYENVPFAQPAGTYLRCWLLPADRSSDDLEGKLTTYLGIFQVDVVGLENVGSGTVGSIVDLIVAQFPTNASITKSTLTIRIIGAASPKPGEYEPGRYIVKVSIPYRCDILT